MSSPGFCLASATSSASVFGPSPGRTSRIDGEFGDAADLREILDRIVRQVRIEPGRDRQRGVGQQQGVAVGRGAHHDRGPGGAARPAAVLDDDRLAELLGQFLRDQARRNVREGAGCERHHDADHLVGPIGLRKAAPPAASGDSAAPTSRLRRFMVVMRVSSDIDLRCGRGRPATA